MNVLIVPDVHGRIFWRRAKELVKNYQKIIFLGDYLDPYKHEGITSDIAFDEFLDIIEFKKKYPKKVTLLLGNHDLHYLFPGFIHSSRRDFFKASKYQKVFEENRDLFTCFKVIGSLGKKWLFSHAGISRQWLEQNKLTLSKLLKMSLEELVDKRGSMYGSLLEQVSHYRGGLLPWGSPVWADIHEFGMGSTVLEKGTIQVVGHNRVDNISMGKKIIYTDCQQLISIDTKKGILQYA